MAGRHDDAFTAWAQGATPRLLRFATLLAGDRSDAEDLVQDTLVAAYSKWHLVSAAGSPTGYAATMLANRHLSLRRSAGRERRRQLVSAPREAADGGYGAVEGSIDARAELAAALAGLPQQHRAAVLLRYVADLPDEDIAAAIGCRPVTVRSHVSRGLASLRAALGEREETP